MLNILLHCVLLLLLPFVHSQNNDNWFPTPFYGQNQPPENTTTDVWVDAYLWRLNSVNEIDYQFNAHLRYTLTWQDPRAAELVQNATARRQEANEPCRRPCDNSNFPAGHPGIQIPQLDSSALCCDDIFLPTLLTDSVLEFPSGNYYSRIMILDNGYVSWSVKFVASYYTSLSFVAYPFDKQLLTILFRTPESPEYADGRVVFRPSTAGISNRFQQGLEHGDELSNYYIHSIYFDVFREPWDQVYRDVTVFPTAATNPSGNIAAQRLSAEYFSISVVIEVYRYAMYHCLVSILPTALLGLMSFAVHHFAPSQVEVRVQTIFSLLLGLLALQYVINANLPSSSYTLPTQQFIVATYVLYLCLLLESFWVYRMATHKPAQQEDDQAHKQGHAESDGTAPHFLGMLPCSCCTNGQHTKSTATPSNKCMLLHSTIPSTQTIAFTRSTGIPLQDKTDTPFATPTNASAQLPSSKSMAYTSPWEHHGQYLCPTSCTSVMISDLQEEKGDGGVNDVVSAVPSSVAVHMHDSTVVCSKQPRRWFVKSVRGDHTAESLVEQRAARVDTYAAIVLLCMYCVAGVLIFVIPVVLQA